MIVTAPRVGAAFLVACVIGAVVLLALPRAAPPSDAVAGRGGLFALSTELTPAAAQAGDAFGWSLDATAASLAVGANNVGGGVGAVYTFTLPSLLPDALLVPPPAGGNGFGGAAYGANVRLSADSARLVTGVFTSYESEGGAVFFQRSAGSFMASQIFNESTPSDMLGSATALSRDAAWLAIAAPSFGGLSGLVYLWARGIFGRYALVQALAPTGGATNFGVSLAFSTQPSVLAIGATAVNGSGCVFVYTLDVTSMTWRPAGPALVPAPSRIGDCFGYSLSISGPLLAVGAWGSSSMFLFSTSSVGWQQQQQLAGSQAAFGWSVALSDDASTLAVGTNSLAGGSVALYTGSATQFQLLQVVNASSSASPPGAGDSFGMAVALTPDGSLLFVGAQGRFAGAGSVFVFARGSAGGGGGGGGGSSLSLGAVGGIVFGVTVVLCNCWGLLWLFRRATQRAQLEQQARAQAQLLEDAYRLEHPDAYANLH